MSKYARPNLRIPAPANWQAIQDRKVQAALRSIDRVIAAENTPVATPKPTPQQQPARKPAIALRGGGAGGGAFCLNLIHLLPVADGPTPAVRREEDDVIVRMEMDSKGKPKPVTITREVRVRR